MSAAEKTAPAPVEELWVSVGERSLSTGKLAGAWSRIDGGKVSDQERLFDGRGFKRFVGAVHKVKVSHEGDRVTVHNGIGDYVRRWEDAAECAKWEALEVAARVAHRRAADEKKDRGVWSLAELLAPVSQAYMRGDTLGRRAILAEVIEAIQTGATSGASVYACSPATAKKVEQRADRLEGALRELLGKAKALAGADSEDSDAVQTLSKAIARAERVLGVES